jgi:hypothetical protein
MVDTSMREPAPWSELVTDAIGYWEPRRLFYNGVLAVVTIWQLLAHGAFPRPIGAGLAALFILAAVANVLYSTATWSICSSSSRSFGVGGAAGVGSFC